MTEPDLIREAERLFASKHECSPAVNKVGRALLSELATARQDAAESSEHEVALARDVEKLSSDLADTWAELVVVRRQLGEAREALREIVELPRAVLWKAYDVARAVLDAGRMVRRDP